MGAVEYLFGGVLRGTGGGVVHGAGRLRVRGPGSESSANGLSVPSSEVALSAAFFLMWTTHSELRPISGREMVSWSHARGHREDQRDRDIGCPGEV